MKTRYIIGDIVKVKKTGGGYKGMVGKVEKVENHKGRTLYRVRSIKLDEYGFRPFSLFFAGSLEKVKK